MKTEVYVSKTIKDIDMKCRKYHKETISFVLSKIHPVSRIWHKLRKFQIVQILCMYNVLQLYKYCNHLDLRNSLMFILVPNMRVFPLVSVEKGSDWTWLL